MPKRNQIPRLFSSKPNAKGIVYWYWKPEKRLRQLGHSNIALGSDQAEAAKAAIAKNEEVETGAPAPTKPGPAKALTFGEIVDRYKRSEAYASLAKSTKADYAMRLKQLNEWAMDGQLAIAAIDKQMLKDLKASWLQIDEHGDIRGSVSATASLLRVLRLLLQWAVDEEEAIEHNPMASLGNKRKPFIPKVQARRTWRDWPTVLGASEHADALGCPYTGPLLRFSFWLAQRRGDMLKLTKFNYREITSVDPRDREVLCDEKGRVMGFYISQSKTDVPVACPLPPFLHAEAEARFARGPNLFPALRDPSQPASSRTIEKVVRQTMNKIGLKDVQLKDMRRSGMSFMNSMGSSEADIRQVSGHTVPGEQRMMEVYMPRSPKMACRAVADALRGMAEIEARMKEAAE